MINIAALLTRAGLAVSEAAAWSAISHGRVQIERWALSIQEGTLPRWVLRGVTISVGDRSIRISEDGRRIIRARAMEIA